MEANKKPLESMNDLLEAYERIGNLRYSVEMMQAMGSCDCGEQAEEIEILTQEIRKYQMAHGHTYKCCGLAFVDGPGCEVCREAEEWEDFIREEIEKNR